MSRANPVPMRFVDPLDYEDARQALKASAERIRAAEDQLETQIKDAAEAEAEYRKALARKIIDLRTGEKPKGATEAETLAKGSDAVAAYSQIRDVKRDMVKHAFAVLEDRRGDRASLHKVVDWSQRLDASASLREREGETYGRRAVA
jgi:hypothetical protein